MRVMGIDPSTKSGVVILDEFRVIESKLVTFDGVAGFKRVHLIAQAIKSLAVEHKPDRFVLEGFAYGNKHSLVILVEISTLIKEAIYPLGVEGWIVPPTVLKKFVTSNGAADKTKMAAHVLQRWGFESPSNDITDAYALAQFGLVLSDGNKPKGVERWT